MQLLDETLTQIIPQDAGYRKKARERLRRLVMPRWALGRLMDLAVELAGMTRSMGPPTSRRIVVVFAADHGVTEAGVSQYPKEVTREMIRVFVSGKAGINALARAVGAQVVVVDMGVADSLSNFAQQGKILSKTLGAGTNNMLEGPAMTREQAAEAVEAGIEVAVELSASSDIFAVGEMGIGNTTAASAIIAAATGAPVASVTGCGSGIGKERLVQKVRAIERALEVNGPDPDDGLDVLSKVGGFEIGAIAGFILGSAAARKPVVLDGFPATAGAIVAHILAPVSAQYMIAGHRSVECGHRLMHRRLKKRPLLDLGMRLGEGTGAVLAMPLIEAAALLLSQVATFEEAGISGASP